MKTNSDLTHLVEVLSKEAYIPIPQLAIKAGITEDYTYELLQTLAYLGCLVTQYSFDNELRLSFNKPDEALKQ